MKFRDRQPEATAELELAPMIDVVFLLLIFFIVSWQFARFEEDMDISVPAAEEKAEEDKAVGEIIVNVTKYGGIVLNGSEVTPEDLLAKLKLIAANYPHQAVILRGHVSTDFQDIIKVLDQVKKAGIINIAFASMKDRPTD
ncbi:MAG: biopolymer transporter ExbD [Verrucomicrobiales bacterium]|nr:biopolymer transporter ExbD [Verrucomicrobiales bacterium]